MLEECEIDILPRKIEIGKSVSLSHLVRGARHLGWLLIAYRFSLQNWEYMDFLEIRNGRGNFFLSSKLCVCF